MAATSVRIANFLGTGIDLLPLPASPGFRQIDWDPTDAVSSNRSPFTTTEQMIEWPGGEQWSGVITLPPLSAADAAEWTATMQGLRGRLHAFQFGDQAQQGLRNPGASDGVTLAIDTTNANVTNAPGTVSVALTGWGANTSQVLMRGDYIQFDWWLYRAMAPVDADANGKAVVIVWPSLRSQLGATTQIDIANPVGIFRRADNTLSWSRMVNGTTSLSFRAVEVR